MSSISENIRKFRIEKGMKQAKLGELLGKAPSVIANWEAGTNRPDINSIEKMCDIFQIDANTLFGWKNHTDMGAITAQEYAHIQKYRRLTDNGRATVDHVIDGLLEAGQVGQEPKEPEKITLPIAARGGTGKPLEATTDTERLLEETKEWRREQIKNSDVF